VCWWSKKLFFFFGVGKEADIPLMGKKMKVKLVNTKLQDEKRMGFPPCLYHSQKNED
jgi:hypothetical protein